MNERTFTYYDGIVEGRLIEHGFFGIGKSMFVCRTINSLYVVTYPEKGDSTLEVFEHVSFNPEEEVELTEFVERARNDDYAFQAIDIKGHIDDIIAVVKMAKVTYN